MTFFQSKPNSPSFGSTASTNERPSNSTSCSMSRSWFSKPARSRRYQDPSTTSGALRLNSAKTSPAGCCDQDIDSNPADPTDAGKSFKMVLSSFG